MAKDEVADVLQKTEGKRAKTKALAEIPKDTKSVRLPSNIAKSINEKFPKAKLSKVMIHTGAEATKACKEIGVKAFTHGNDIYVAKSGDAKDNKLLAHELSHVVQQSHGKMPSAQKGKVLTSK